MKLSEYLERNGIKKSWFADQLGIPSGNFSYFLKSTRGFPKQYWKKIIELTKGAVHISDLAGDLELAEKEAKERNVKKKLNKG